MLAFCNFEKYQEYTFLHKTQEILSSGAGAIASWLFVWRIGAHGLPLVHAQASPDQVVQVAVWIESASAPQQALEDPVWVL